MPAQRIPLNFIDFFHLANSDVTIANPIVTLCFREPHSSDEIKSAMRHLLRIYPKLRSIIEPSLFSYRFRIMDDSDPRVDILFNDAFRSCKNIEFDSPEYIEMRHMLFNEPVSLEHALPLKIRYCENTSEPVLLMGMHHVAGDGASWIHLIGSLMAYLNGKSPEPYPLDNPSLSPVYLENKGRLLNQISQAFKRFEIGKPSPVKISIVPASKNTVDFYGPVNIYHKTLSHELTIVKAKSKKLECTTNTFFLTALSLLFSREPVKDLGNTIRIGLPIDLRQYYPDTKPIFGNHLSGTDINIPQSIWNDAHKIITHINQQIDNYIRMTKEKRLLAQAAFFKLTTFAGRKIYAHGIRTAKRKGLINRTCGLSNIGDLDHLNSHGRKAQLKNATYSGASHGLLILLHSLNGKINLTLSFQEAEFTLEKIRDIILKLENIIGELLVL